MYSLPDFCASAVAWRSFCRRNGSGGNRGHLSGRFYDPLADLLQAGLFLGMILRPLVRFLWREYGAETKFYPSTKVWLKHWLIQKVFRFNGYVPWPVHPTSKVSSPEKINRGTRTPGLSHGCHIDGRNGIVFGANVWVGPHVAIISMNHDVNDYCKYIKENPIVIGDDCWFGAKAVILPGVRLGKHTVVAAGSVVTKSFPEGDQVLAGTPARVVKKLPPYEGVSK